ncbi:hypothetical protein [Euzebya pacifica]|uniref:hypothetical protein n=1 Tax=Euzebya pacifica TaxID=1608957 RepID=UPI001C1F5811|nr:hypothetical protein [Euzebya pacifica]
MALHRDTSAEAVIDRDPTLTREDKDVLLGMLAALRDCSSPVVALSAGPSPSS